MNTMNINSFTVYNVDIVWLHQSLQKLTEQSFQENKENKKIEKKNTIYAKHFAYILNIDFFTNVCLLK